MNQISYKIKALRELNSLKQSDLARALNVSQQLVSSWERGVQLPDLNTVNQMTKYFNVSFDDLLSNKPIKPVAMNDYIHSDAEEELISSSFFCALKNEF